MTDAEIRDTSAFRAEIQKYRTVRGELVRTTSEATLKYYKEKVDEFVRADPLINDTLQAIMAELKVQFPKMAHDALCVYFASFMSHMAGSITTNFMQTSMLTQQMSNIVDRLGNQQ